MSTRPVRAVRAFLRPGVSRSARWYNDGRYERECAEWSEWRDNWEGIKRHRNQRGETFCVEGPPRFVFFEPGYDANGSPVA